MSLSMDVKPRAARTAQIFDLLAMVVLGVGALAVFAQIVAVIYMAVSGDGGFFVLAGIVGVLVAIVMTALAWAGVTLATVVAGYIADRS
jgi:hypothetical protein